MKLHQSGLRYYFLCFSSVLLCIACLTGTINASIQNTDAIWNETDLQIVGTLTYMGSSTGYDPVNRLSGQHGIEFSKESENCFIKEPYLTSVSQETLVGILDEGYNVSFGYGTWLCVSQPLNSQYGTRDGTAYYRVDVSRIDTQLLYRPERAEKALSIVVGGAILISLYSVLRWVRGK